MCNAGYILLLLNCLWLGLSGAEYEHFRLPTAVRPLKYYLRILTHLDNVTDIGHDELSFEGDVRILLHAVESTNNITLHAKNLTINEASINLKALYDAEGTENCILSTQIIAQYDYLVLHLCTKLKAHYAYELTLSFAAPLNRSLSGYYRSSYVVAATNETRWLAVTQFSPNDARTAFPCFDEPTFKARFFITLGHHRNYNALSNMPLVRTYNNSALVDYVWSEFDETPLMSTYLVGFTVNDFAKRRSIQESRIQITTWARNDAIKHTMLANHDASKIVKYYERLLGIKYPLKKLDQMAVPQHKFTAMENWGLITFKETALLYEPNVTTYQKRKSNLATMGHELAHKWFGNLVTMKWWDNVWMKEGFANHFSNLAVNNSHPDWHWLEYQPVDWLLSIFPMDSLESTRAMSAPVETVTTGIFNALPYKRGALIVRMMHKFLGDEAFFKGIINYLQEFQYNNADQDDLWRALHGAAQYYNLLPHKYKMKTIMDSWTLQAGYPLVTVNRDYKKATAKVVQQRYLSQTVKADALHNNCWWVPLFYTSKMEREFVPSNKQQWLECTKHGLSVAKQLKSLPAADEWILLNTELSGYYRVNYDERNWQLLLDTLQHGEYEHINLLSRVQLINDAFTLAWDGHLKADILIGFIDYLRREQNDLPWFVFKKNLANIFAARHSVPSAPLNTFEHI